MRPPSLHVGSLLVLLLIAFAPATTDHIGDSDLIFDLDDGHYSSQKSPSALIEHNHDDGILHRIKRQFDIFNWFSTTTQAPTTQSSADSGNSNELEPSQQQQRDEDKEDIYDEDNVEEQAEDDTWKTATSEPPLSENNIGIDNDDEDFNPNFHGSGDNSHRSLIPPGREMTIRVSFVVREPYKTEYSSRDSQPFRQLSRALADAVDDLYDTEPGEQKATLVRIQSRPADEYTCKVTLDLQTINFYDYEQLKQVLRRHIRDNGRLGSYIVSDEEFSSKNFDENLDKRLKCSETQVPCISGQCIDADLRCDGTVDCNDGSDELGCRDDDEVLTTRQPEESTSEYTPLRSTESQTEPQTASPETQRPISSNCRADDQVRCGNSNVYICQEQLCDGNENCPDGYDELDCGRDPNENDGDRNPECREQEMVCDITRCVPLSKRCDRIPDCQDGRDELDCPNQCRPGDFACNDGKCIEAFRECDDVLDCVGGEDEVGCACTPDEFRCGNGTCIELRRRCDGQPNCDDQSDEIDCPGRPGTEEPHRGDEFRCETGIYINRSLVCNWKYDCPHGDFSDERNCPCKKEQFVCKNGVCIDPKLRCDGTVHCNDESDEENCEDFQCKPGQYTCKNNKCIEDISVCDGKKDCMYGEDERGCVCTSNQFECKSEEFCIDKKFVCDGIMDCMYGEDESHCELYTGRCDNGQFTCNNNQCIPLSWSCNGRNDCLDGSDEAGCPDEECTYQCSDDLCYGEEERCDGTEYCSDGGDEVNCEDCEFRCDDGKCILEEQQCDGSDDCLDRSDELNCSSASTPFYPSGCKDDEFHCDSGQCIQLNFRCDRINDCIDNSDEKNCPKEGDCKDGIVCDGKCVESDAKCDGVNDCSDGRDEEGCLTQACPTNQYACADGKCIPFQLVCNRNLDCDDGSDERDCECSYDQWKCISGECVSYTARCDGVNDCRDGSDEDSPPCSPKVVTQPPFYDTTVSWQYPTGYPTFPTEYPTSYRPPYTPPPTTYRPVWGSSLQLRTYPNEQIIRQNGDVVFQCRDEGPLRAKVQWIREGNRPLPAGSIDNNGRLEIPKIQLADAGIYICQAIGYRNLPGNEQQATLEVERYMAGTTVQPSRACKEYEATCSNGDCIPKAAICDKNFDCRDGSDESACPTHSNGLCEPNEFKCANRRCISKAWFCDSDDDCRDGSDEANCPAPPPGAFCRSTEFECSTGQQCIPKNYHCDGSNDCADGSDEHSCSPIYISKPPVRQLRLNEHETMVITCVAIGVPTPIVSWRLNWGHIPSKCTTTSTNGVGTLTCPDIVESDQGAYSCEALSSKGFVFAIPDTILIVNSSNPIDICPAGYFNSEARSPSECITCFCFGASTTCKSADLFTYQLPTPLGQGGTRLVGVVQPQQDSYQVTDEPISDIFDLRTTYNGATVTRIGQWSTRNIYPYIALSESYHGNQLTSYGGYINYNIRPYLDFQRPPQYTPFPDILIRGGNNLLAHRVPGGIKPNQDNNVSVRLFVGAWQKVTQYGLQPATREDIMMTLAQVDGILLRGEESGGSIDIRDFKMDSAGSVNTGQGSAAFVEECSCPRGYSGLSCQACSQGFTRLSSGRWLGQCVADEPLSCPVGFYGDLANGIPCQQCPCPLTNPGNQFSRTCRLDSEGLVVCNCPAGYDGRRCERCSDGYVGNPTIPGDSCKPYIPPPTQKCDMRGTQNEEGGVCRCKEYVEGEKCDRCVKDAFHLSYDNNFGCSECFCMGITTSCTSSSLRRSVRSVKFVSRAAVSDVRLVDWPNPPGIEPRFITTGLYSDTNTQELTFNQFDMQNPTTYYWALPAASFSGNKITSYGGFLNYTIRHVPAPGGQSSKNNAPAVQLISSNDIILLHYEGATPDADGYLTNTVQLTELYWQKSDGYPAHRQDILMALADLEAILVKATYTTSTQQASLIFASLEVSDESGTGQRALHVEQCRCPQGYLGTSCEDCAPGYTRADNGIYLGFCEPCNCNGHSNQCNPESGECSNCGQNTSGANCEECIYGYELDSDGNCRESEPSNKNECRCDPRGSIQPICANGDFTCNCKANVVGPTCNQCATGTFKLSTANPAGCTECFCSGVASQCHEANHLYKQQIPTAIIDQNHGFKLATADAGQVITRDFILNVPFNQISYRFDRYAPDTLYWSLPQIFSGDRITSYAGNLNITQRYDTNDPQAAPVDDKDVILVGDELSIFWTNPRRIRPRELSIYTIPLRESSDWRTLEYGAAPRPVSRNDMLRVLSNLRNILVRATLAQGITESFISDVSMDTALPTNGAGQSLAQNIEVCVCPVGYEGTSCERCQAGYYRDTSFRCLPCPCGGRADSCSLGRDRVVQCDCIPPYSGPDCSIDNGDVVPPTTSGPPPPLPPQPSIKVTVSAPTIEIKEVGSTVRFKCSATSRYFDTPIRITWTREGGTLPPARTIVESNTGELVISDVKESDSGTYLCQASDGYSTGYDRATLTVQGNDRTEPKVTISDTVLEVYEGNSFELRCDATGNPAPTTTWVRTNRRTLNPSYSSVKGIYRVEDARITDQGEYRCVASNPYGQDQKLAVVYVIPRPDGPKAIRLIATPSQPEINEGDSYTIACTSDQYVPTNYITWSRVDGTLPENFRSYSGQLRINAVRPEDSGVYRCSADGYQEPVMAVTVPIKVRQFSPQPTQQPDVPASVVIDVDSAAIPEGGNFTINCRPEGVPIPIIKWTKVDSEFGAGVNQRGNALVFSNAKMSDRGLYVCVGSTEGGLNVQASTVIEIEHREKPQVEIWPYGPQQVLIGGEARLQCRTIAGAPEPVVTWSRPSGRPLSANTHLMAGGVLSLTSVTVNEEGMYTCTGSNIAGEHSASATLEIFSPPSIVVRPDTYFSVQQGTPLTVECRVTGYPEPTAYWTMVSPQERIVTSKTPGMSILSLPYVQESDEGTYLCIAQNSAGTYEEEIRITITDNEIGAPAQNNGAGEPNFSGPPANQTYTAIQGEVAVLRCEVPSQYNKFVTSWVRFGGAPLPRGSQNREDLLYLRNVTTNDAGVYECRVRDALTGAVVYTVRIPLVVVVPPRIVLRPPTQTVRPGDTAHLKCDVTGDEPLDVQWSPQRGSFPDRVEVRGSSLVFHGIELRDAGRYTCKATNNAGVAEAIAEVIVNASVSTVQTSTRKQQTAAAGSSVELSCTAGINGAEVAWSRLNSTLPARVKTLPGGVLLLEKVHKKDTGRYVCRSTSLDGRTNQDYVDLLITGTEANPLVISSQQNLIIEGDAVQVDCRSSGKPLQVTWVVNPPTRRLLDVRPYLNGATLYFDRAGIQDSGIYQCTGRDIYGTQFYAEYTLTVIPYSAVSPSDAPPKENEVDDGYADIVKSAPLGSSVELSCDHNVEGSVKYQWSRPNANLSPRLDSTAGKLRLTKLTESDAGPYVCQVTNGRVAIQRRIVLRITNVVPRFEGNGFLALEKLVDAYTSVDVEVSVKPEDYNGIILYNGGKQGPTMEFTSLALVDGVPEYKYNLGAGTTVIRADSPLELNQWHTIKIGRRMKNGFMFVDGQGPFRGTAEGSYQGLDLANDLYVGGVPDTNQLPSGFVPQAGFVGCVGRLSLGETDSSLLKDAKETRGLQECDSCTPNPCYNNAVCQDALNERGYTCLCPDGFSGRECSRPGESCRPGVCGKGRCFDTDDGLKCSCPLGYNGRRCENEVDIEYPAFDGGAYIAYAPPKPIRHLKMSLRMKPAEPVTDGIVLYCAESRHGHGDFTSLAVKDGYLEFRFDMGSGPAIIKSLHPIQGNDWINVTISRITNRGKMTLNGKDLVSGISPGSKDMLFLKTPLYVGGYDQQWLTVNKGVGVQNGFTGCITDVEIQGAKLDIVKSPVQSQNVQECTSQQYSNIEGSTHRGDMPPDGNESSDDACSRCENGGYCLTQDSLYCTCPPGYEGQRCEVRSLRGARVGNACDAQPCQNGGTCRITRGGIYRCDCPLSFGGFNCKLRIELRESVSLNGEGYVELPASLLPHDRNNDPETIAMAFSTDQPDGLLFYQGEEGSTAKDGDFILLQVVGGIVELHWELGGGVGVIKISEIPVSDGNRHQVIVRRKGVDAYLEVDEHQEQGRAPGLTQIFNADSNIYIGGVPVALNPAGFIGFNGCIYQVELQDSRALNLGQYAIASRNAASCSNLETNDIGAERVNK